VERHADLLGSQRIGEARVDMENSEVGLVVLEDIMTIQGIVDNLRVTRCLGVIPNDDES
jgi:hypothetical protein